MTRPIFFLTDFGLADSYVGVVKAVILTVAPDATIVDLTHDVPAQDVRAGAFALLTAAPYLPDDAVVLAVVDPEVGTARRPIAVQAGGRSFVAPDNGLLSWALGDGSHVAVVLDRPRYWRPTLSATFHGRDLFGPVAAYLARGVPLAEVGSPCGDLVTLPFPRIHQGVDAGGALVAVRGEVIHVDRFGNLITNLTAPDLPPEPVVELAGRRMLGLAPHYQRPSPSDRPAALEPAWTDGPQGDPPAIALIGSAGFLEVAVPNGSAAAALGAGVGVAVVVTTASPRIGPR